MIRLIVSLFLLLPLLAQSATYYVDFAAGSDAANGTTTGTPWKHCPGDPNATGTAGSSTLSAGDTVDFRMGTVYTASYVGIILSWSGATNNPITYTSTWGTGDPATLGTGNSVEDLSTSNGSARMFDDNGAARNFLTFSNLLIQDVGGTATNAAILNGLDGLSLSEATDTITKTNHGLVEGYKLRHYSGIGGFTNLTRYTVNYYARNVTENTFQLATSSTGTPIDFSSDGTGQLYVKEPPGGNGIALEGGGTGIIVTNCAFNRIGTWQGGSPFGDTTAVSGYGVLLADNSNTIVGGCTFRRMKTGVSIKPTTAGCNGITIIDSTFSTNMNWLIDIAPGVSSGSIIQGITIDRCSFYDYAQLDQTQWTANGGVRDSPHQDGIFMRVAGFPSTWTNIVVRNCLFWKDDTNTPGGTASIFLSQGASADIYNCVFRQDKHSNGHMSVGYDKLPGMYQRIRVWNCSFYGSASYHIKCTPGNSNPDVYEVLNCVAYRPSTYVVETINPAAIGTLLHDYNVFYSENASWYAAVNTDTTYMSLADWQTYSGQDANSVWADPLFTSVSGNPSQWDLRPAAGSPLIDAGTDLSMHFTTDITGATRTGTWDIGAYEYGGGGGVDPETGSASVMRVGGAVRAGRVTRP
jgi:hypothetical protein